MNVILKDCESLPIDRDTLNSFILIRKKFAIIIDDPASERYYPIALKTLNEARDNAKIIAEYGGKVKVAYLCRLDSTLKVLCRYGYEN